MLTFCSSKPASIDKPKPLRLRLSGDKTLTLAGGELKTLAVFCFLTRNAAQASKSRSGAFLKRDDAKPHRKRVEVYSAAMTPAQGVCVDLSKKCHSWGLQRVPSETDAKRPSPRFCGYGSFLPENPRIQIAL